MFNYLVSSTINQSEYYKHVPNVNAASDDSSNNNQKASLLNEENEEDLLSFRNHLQEQLKLKLFNSTSLEHANKNNKQVKFMENLLCDFIKLLSRQLSCVLLFVFKLFSLDKVK